MAIKRKCIVVPEGAVAKIVSRTGAGKTSVYDALNFKTFTDAAKRIRQLAVGEYGGIETTKVVFD